MNNKGKMNTGKKVMRSAGLAVAFGALAGAMMFGVYTLGNTFTAGVLETADTRTASSCVEDVDTMNSLTSVNLGKGLLQEAGTVSTDTSDTAESLGSVEAVVEECMPSVVTIGTVSVQEMRSIFGGGQQYEAQGAGTGVIVAANDTELLIATNNHVVEGAKSLSVGFIDESSYEATIKGTDAQNDLAVIAVKLDDISEETMSQIKIAKIGSSDDLSIIESYLIFLILNFLSSIVHNYFHDANTPDFSGFNISKGLTHLKP